VVLALPWGQQTDAVRTVVAGLVFVLALADVVGLQLHLRQTSRQVPPVWRVKYPAPWGYPLMWGFLLGLGFTTIAPSSALYVMALLVLPWPEMAALSFLVFGVTRGLSVFVGQLASARRTPSDVVTQVWRLSHITRMANAFVAVLVAIAVSGA